MTFSYLTTSVNSRISRRVRLVAAQLFTLHSVVGPLCLIGLFLFPSASNANETDDGRTRAAHAYYAIVKDRNAPVRIDSKIVGYMSWGELLRIEQTEGQWARFAPVERIRSCCSGWIETSQLLEVRSKDQMIEFFDSEIKRHPNDERAYIYRALARWHVSIDRQKLISESADAIKVAPTKPLGYVLRSLAYRYASRNNDAMSDVNQALALDPDCLPALYERSTLYLEIDKLDLSLADANRAVSLNTTDSRFYDIIAYIYCAQNKPLDALISIGKGIALDLRWADGYAHRHRILIGLGNLEAAFDDIDAAVRLEPNNANYLSQRAITEYYLGNSVQSNRDITSAIALDPKGADIAIKCIELCSGLENAINIFPILEEYARANPNNAYLNGQIGSLLVNMGRGRDAIHAYNQAIAADPLQAKPYMMRGTLHGLLGDHDKAISDLRRGGELDSNYRGIQVPRALFEPESAWELPRIEKSLPQAALIAASFDIPIFSKGLIIPVKMGKRTLRMIVDTGSPVSIFDDSIRDLLGTKTGLASIKCFSGSVILDRYPPVELKIGSLHLSSKMPVSDPLFTKHFGASLGEPIHGLLGLDVLKDTIMQLDLVHGKLFFLRDVPSDLSVQYPLHVVGGAQQMYKASTEVVFPGIGARELNVDTGAASTTLTITAETAQGVARAGGLTPFANVSQIEMSGNTINRLHAIANVRAFRNNHQSLTGTEVSRHESIGLNYFRRFIATLDLRNGWIYLRPSPAFAFSEARLALCRNESILEFAKGSDPERGRHR